MQLLPISDGFPLHLCEIQPNLPSIIYLRCHWNESTECGEEPVAGATFGIDEGNGVPFYMRQLYQKRL